MIQEYSRIFLKVILASKQSWKVHFWTSKLIFECFKSIFWTSMPPMPQSYSILWTSGDGDDGGGGGGFPRTLESGRSPGPTCPGTTYPVRGIPHFD